MKASLLALFITLYLYGLQWSADQRKIAGLENTVAGLEKMVVKSQLRSHWDKLIIDKWTGLDWDRSKPIRKDCEKVNFCWTEIDSCTLYQ